MLRPWLLLPCLALLACRPPVRPRAAAAGTLATSHLLTQKGRDIVDASGNPVTLTGVNVGGWLEWEGWIWGGGYTGMSSIQSQFASVVGEGAANAFTQRVYDTYVQEADVEEMGRVGFNVVRVNFSRKNLEDPAHPGAFLDSGWAVLDRMLDWCDTYGVYAVLDLHDAPGGQSAFFIADPESTLLWTSPEAQDRTVALWTALAARYRDRDAVAGYDLLNEPAPPNGAALHDLDVRIAAAIRTVDTRHLLFIEGASSAKDFSMFQTPIDAKLVYSFHSYETGQAQKKAVAGYAALSQAQNVPLWAGEFGIQNSSTVSAAVDTFNAAHVSGQALWTWKSAEGNPVLALPTAGDDWKQVMRWSNLWFASAQPSAEVLSAGIEEFFAAVPFSATTEDRGMVTALGGQP